MMWSTMREKRSWKSDISNTQDSGNSIKVDVCSVIWCPQRDKDIDKQKRNRAQCNLSCTTHNARPNFDCNESCTSQVR